MQYKHRRHTGKEVDWNCACLCTKCGFSTTIISTKMHPFVVAVVFKFKLPECWNMREGSSGKKISFQKKRIMGLHFQMLSFVMENGKQNVCQKIGEKNSLQILVLVEFTTASASFPSLHKTCAGKIKTSETHVISSVLSGSEDLRF